MMEDPRNSIELTINGAMTSCENWGTEKAKNNGPSTSEDSQQMKGNVKAISQNEGGSKSLKKWI